jgi:putative acetyltransferase
VTLEIVTEVSENDFDTLVEVWEASVRATHDFIAEENIQYFKPIVRNEALPNIELRCVRDPNERPVGFIGVANGKVEMLFIHPNYRGKGIGRTLLEYAVQHLNATELDVNEQNPQAVGFYKNMGFVVVGRSDLDGMGKPFPLLHMKFSK